MTFAEMSLNSLADSVAESGMAIAVAETFTGGQLSTALAAAPDAAEWFRGGVVDAAADVLGLTEGDAATELRAREMAKGVCILLDARVGVAVTGEAGTVFAAVHTTRHVVVREWHFEGTAHEVIEATIRATLGLVAVEVSLLAA